MLHGSALSISTTVAVVAAVESPPDAALAKATSVEPSSIICREGGLHKRAACPEQIAEVIVKTAASRYLCTDLLEKGMPQVGHSPSRSLVLSGSIGQKNSVVLK